MQLSCLMACARYKFLETIAEKRALNSSPVELYQREGYCVLAIPVYLERSSIRGLELSRLFLMQYYQVSRMKDNLLNAFVIW